MKERTISDDANEESWEWSRLRPWMLVIAQQALPDFIRHRVDASDIVQQVMTEAWKGRAQYRGSTTAEQMAWLRVILKRSIGRQQERLLGTQKRDMRREASVDFSVENASLRIERFAVDTLTQPDAAAEKAEQVVRITEVLAQLPPDYRQVLILRHFEDLDHEAIGHRMNRTASASRMLWIRALKSLRETLDISHE